MFKKVILSIILPATIGLFIPQDAQSGREKQVKRIYIRKLTVRGDAAKVTGDFRDSLIVHFLEQGRGKYHIISDEDIQVMYKQAAELQASGSDAEDSLRQIAYGISADYMIYGTISVVGNQYKGLFTALKRNSQTDELTKSAMVNIRFYESQVSWYSGEVVKKLLSPTYRINPRDAPLAIGISFDLSKMEGMDIKRIRIRFQDTTIRQIVNYLKEIIAEGDGFFKEKDYDSALKKYTLVFERIRTKLPPYKQKKLSTFIKLIHKRRDLIHTIKARQAEKSADEYYIRVECEKALEGYSNAVSILAKVGNKKSKEYKKYYKTLLHKKDLVNKTGRNHFLNKIRSFCNRIDYLNIKGEKDRADQTFEEARAFYQGSVFQNKEAMEMLNARARLLNLAGIFLPGFVYIQGGCFMMGSLAGYGDEKLHRVCVDSFWMGRYEVTQAQWLAVMGDNPSSFKGDNKPVESVSWNDVQEFIRKFNRKYSLSVRLPTEAEWEYAARAGSTTKYYWGDDSSEMYKYVNFCDKNCKYKRKDKNQDDGYENTSPVGSFMPNKFGLYDMTGNVWEWCQDWYERNYYSKSPERNPKGASGGSVRVNRGGSWDCDADSLRSAGRDSGDPGLGYGDLGFRLIRVR